MIAGALDWGGVVAPLAVLGAALVVVAVALASRRRRRMLDPVAAALAKGPAGRWRVEHGPAVDAWLDAYRRRFAGLADALAGRTPLDVPDPVDGPVEEAMAAAIAASPDDALRTSLEALHQAGQSALVATVAGRLSTAETEYERYLSARSEALVRLGELMGRPTEPTVDPG